MICNRCGYQGTGDHWNCPRCGNVLAPPQRQAYASGNNAMPVRDYMAPSYAPPMPSGNAFGYAPPAAMGPMNPPASYAGQYGAGMNLPEPAQDYDLSVLNGMLNTQSPMSREANPSGYFANNGMPGYGPSGQGGNNPAMPTQNNTYPVYGQQPPSNPYGGPANAPMPSPPGQPQQQPQPQQQQPQQQPQQDYYGRPQAPWSQNYGQPYPPQGMRPDGYGGGMPPQPGPYGNPYGVPGQPPGMMPVAPGMMPRQTPTPRTVPGDTGRIYLSHMEMGTGQPAAPASENKARSAWVPWLVALIVVLVILIGLLLGYYFFAETPFTPENLWLYYQDLLRGLFSSSGA